MAISNEERSIFNCNRKKINRLSKRANFPTSLDVEEQKIFKNRSPQIYLGD